MLIHDWLVTAVIFSGYIFMCPARRSGHLAVPSPEAAP